MARGRLISRTLGSSRRFHELLQAGGKLGEFCQVLFPLIIANTDDFGRMAGDAFTIKNVVLPSSKRPETDFDRALDVLARVGLIERYTVDGSIFLQVNKFDEHQQGLHKRTESRFPEFPGISGRFRSNRTEGKGTEGNRTEPLARERTADALFEEFWRAYPKKKAREAARKAWDRRRPDEALLAVMLDALRIQARSEDWTKERGRYVPFPATWLNQARWTDEQGLGIVAIGGQIRQAWECPHMPACAHPTTCQRLQMLEQARKAQAS